MDPPFSSDHCHDVLKMTTSHWWSSCGLHNRDEATSKPLHRAGDHALVGRGPTGPDHPDRTPLAHRRGSAPADQPPRRRRGRGLVPDPERGRDEGPTVGRRTRPVAHAASRRRAVRGHEAVAPRPRRRDPGSPAAIPQDRAVQRAPPCAVLGANTGLTTRQLVPMLPPPGEAVERSVQCADRGGDPTCPMPGPRPPVSSR